MLSGYLLQTLFGMFAIAVGLRMFRGGKARNSRLHETSWIMVSVATLIIMLTSSLFAPADAALAHRLPEQGLKYVFALFLIVVGTKLLVG